MEAYRTKCRDSKCGFERTWIGYKTGIGKTDAQLAEMRKDETTCVKCTGPADTVPDERGLVGAMEAQDRVLEAHRSEVKFLQY